MTDTAIKFVKFCEDKDMDWRNRKLIIWFYHFNLEEFMEIVGGRYFSDGGMEVRLLEHGTIGADITDLCEYLDIDPEVLHPKESSDI